MIKYAYSIKKERKLMMKLFRNPYLIKIGKIMAVFILTILISGASIKHMAIQSETHIDSKYLAESSNSQVDLLLKEEEKNNIDNFINNNEEQIRFFANMFGIDYEIAIAKIREINIDPNTFNENNIGLIRDFDGNIINYNSVDRGILEFFSFLDNSFPELVNNSYRPGPNNPEYVEALIQYFSTLYNNVDHKLMLSIGAAESGYYTAKTMLYKNNIYGGMGSNGLIQYKNIEYGVWQYIKKMSEQYYDKGLNTIESIGYVFCPQMINGIKTVSSHWVSLVTKAMETYTYDIRYVSISQLNDLVNNEINEI